MDRGRTSRQARRAPARTSHRSLPVHARGALRRHPRPDRVRRSHGHDERPARDLRDVLELRRGCTPLGLERVDTLEALQARRADGRIDRARRYAARPYRSSSFPTTARHRARRSSSATATPSRTSSGNPSRRGTWRGSRVGTSRTPWSGSRSRSDRRAAREEEALESDVSEGRHRARVEATWASSTSWMSRGG